MQKIADDSKIYWMYMWDVMWRQRVNYAGPFPKTDKLALLGNVGSLPVSNISRLDFSILQHYANQGI